MADYNDLKSLRKMEHLLQRSKCSIFHDDFAEALKHFNIRNELNLINATITLKDLNKAEHSYRLYALFLKEC